jgi:secreted trypsin-like serine protease
VRANRIAMGVTIAAAATAIVPPTKAQEAVEKRANDRVVGGKETDIAKHPFQVAISMPGRRSIWCGGSIIDEYWVLTAAHCFFDRSGKRIPDDRFVVKVGATNIAKQGTWQAIDRIVAHKGYDPNTYLDDISMIKFSTPTEKNRRIALASSATSDGPPAVAVVTGWGDTTYSGLPSDILREVSIPLVNNVTCNTPDSYGGRVTNQMLCAGRAEGGKDSCQGDSGGPLVLGTGAGATLIGIVSWGEGCAQAKKYGVYTRVSAHRTWISTVMRGN